MLAAPRRLLQVCTGAGVRRWQHTATALQYDACGPPEKVLRLTTVDLPAMTPTSIRVRMLAAPINPADINQIEGVYPIKPQLPAIGGNEGVAVVEEVGSAVTDLRVGDWVLPTTPGFGTWRTHAVHAADEFTRVANDIPPEYAATLTVNPATAYRMLKDFADLRAGDTVVQNGATSAVGRSVIQIAHARGINTINIVRDRPNLAETEAALKAIGATHVVTEEFARTPAMRDIVAGLPRAPRLALNCVGGKSSTQLLRLIGPGGIHVTYGGMSREPVVVPTSALIFQDVQVRGFWMSEWYRTHTRADRDAILADLAAMVRQGHLHFTFQHAALDTYGAALAHAGSGNAKQIFMF